MNELKPCPKCNNTGWVCEKHPNKPMEHKITLLGRKECDYPGMPCACNKSNPPWVYPNLKTRQGDKPCKE